jgi:hypothetical protein
MEVAEAAEVLVAAAVRESGMRPAAKPRFTLKGQLSWDGSEASGAWILPRSRRPWSLSKSN